VRIIAGRRIVPAPTVPDDEDDAIDHPSIVNLEIPYDKGKYGSIPRICASVSKKLGHRGVSQHANESIQTPLRKNINGS
jgi:hypothetical protein